MSSEKPKENSAASILIVHMLYGAEPNTDPQQLLRNVNRSLPQTTFLGEPTPTLICFAHAGHETVCADGKGIPGQTAIFTPNKPGGVSDLRPYIEQTRDWSGAAAIAPQCKYERTAVEFLSQGLAPSTRLRLMRCVIQAMIEETKPLAIAWEAAQKLIDPAEWLKASGAANLSAATRQILNVRLFRITNGHDGDLLMDSRGLAELGLPDLQMHFRNLDAERVAGFLYGLAEYVLSKGDVIASGHTVEGIDGQRWKCQHEMSLWTPKRVVLDVNPGPQFAAGSRSN